MLNAKMIALNSSNVW